MRCFGCHLPHRGPDLVIQAERCLLSDRLLETKSHYLVTFISHNITFVKIGQLF